MSESSIRTLPKFGSQEYRDYFRTDFVEKDGTGRLLGIKNGNLYAVVLLGIITFVPCTIAWQISEFHLYYLALLPIYFLICNLIEYLLHRYPMHHKTKGLGFLHQHLTIHHSFFNGEVYYYEHPRDYMAVFLPILYYLFISAVFCTGGFLMYLTVDLNNALFFLVVSFSYYLMYEVMHFSFHAKKGSLIKKLPFVELSAHLHLLHHRANLMNKYNFNITFPIFDTVFNTLYKEPETRPKESPSMGQPNFVSK